LCTQNACSAGLSKYASDFALMRSTSSRGRSVSSSGRVPRRAAMAL
jgi:hypothetical protein